MNVPDLFTSLNDQANKRVYFSRLDVLEQSVNLIKARLYISPELFVQVYRNDRFDTTNFALIFNGMRIYARDQFSGIWHRHTQVEPELHDTGENGRKSITLAEFLDEIEIILGEMNLP